MLPKKKVQVMLTENTFQLLMSLSGMTGYPKSVVIDIAIQEMFIREEEKREGK